MGGPAAKIDGHYGEVTSVGFLKMVGSAIFKLNTNLSWYLALLVHDAL